MSMTAFLVHTDFNTPPFDLAVKFTPNSLNAFCLDEQKKLLRRLLGVSLFTDFSAAFPIADADQKWKDLANGATYEIDGITYEWLGMKEMLKPYTFYRWLIERHETVTGFDSTVRGKPENAENQSAARKIGRASFEFLKMVGEKNAQENSLYGFLNSRSDDFSNWIKWRYQDLPRINSLGI